MLFEAVRVVADWMADPTNGVNATLLAAPLEAGVTRAAPVTVSDDTRNPEVARGQIPDALPALLVTTTATAITLTSPVVRPYPSDVLVELGIRYAAANVATEVAFNDTAQVLRAVTACLGTLWTTAAGEAARLRNQVQLLELREIRTELYQANDDSRVTMGMLLTVRVRDLFATS